MKHKHKQKGYAKAIIYAAKVAREFYYRNDNILLNGHEINNIKVGLPNVDFDTKLEYSNKIKKKY